MRNEASGGAAHGDARRTTNIFTAFAVAGFLLFGLAAAAAAQTSGAPLIRIPPATLPPPLAAAPASPAAPAASPAAPGKIPPEPGTLLPTHVQLLRDSPGAGLAMYGALGGKAASAVGVILAIFANSQAFDPAPSPGLSLVLADEADRHAQALFTARVRGLPVIGIAVAALSDSGGDVTVIYDAADAFAASFPRMRRALAASNGVGMAVLAPLRLADGGTIDVPPGWQIIAQGPGSVALRGPQGEALALGEMLPVYAAPAAGPRQLHGACCDPVEAFAAIYPQIAAMERAGSDAVEPGDILDSAAAGGGTAADRSAFILSDLRAGGENRLHLAQAEAIAGLIDPWTFRLSEVMAPQAVFAAELPLLMRIWTSYSGTAAGLRDRLAQALQAMKPTREMLQSTIAARQTGDYNAAPAWAEAIAAVAGRKDGRIDRELAESLAKGLSSDTKSAWRVVDPAEWK
ncbi:MAG TPA: hypothetical protein VG651_12910 [Stellaceae bacterium]|nr:hypothetical protein [Stellaceae bacterium]